MEYQPLTNQFGLDELKRLQETPADILAEQLKFSDPIVALRGVAEVMLNEDNDKLVLLLADADLVEHYSKYGGDAYVNVEDIFYAIMLEGRVSALKNKD